MRAGTNVLLGRRCRQGKVPIGPMLDPNGCLARSAMRTQPSTEETGAVQNNVAGLQRLKWIWQLALPKKALRYLTTGRLMGVTVTLAVSQGCGVYFCSFCHTASIIFIAASSG
jgi:hypothetical protein